MSFASRLKEAREHKNFTQKELAQLVGIGNTAISNYEKEISFPNVDILYKIFDVLQIEPNFFFQDEIHYSESISIDEKQLLDKFRNLDQHSQYVIHTVVEAETKRFSESQKRHINVNTISQQKLSYYDMPVSAGLGNPLDYENLSSIYVSEEPPPQTDYVLRISGDSMVPTFADGDYIYVQKTDTLQYGQIGIFSVNGAVYVKEYGRNGLISHNSNYAVITGTADVKCLGKVIGKVNGKVTF